MGKHTERRHKLRAQVLEKYGNRCATCGFAVKRALEVDHIQGGGKSDRRQRHQDRTTWLREALKDNSKYQLLCANCNRIKQFENKEWEAQKQFEMQLLS